MISGAGNAALDWACDIAPYAESVRLVYRKDKMKGYEGTQAKLCDKDVILHPNSQITALIGDDQHEKSKKSCSRTMKPEKQKPFQLMK